MSASRPVMTAGTAGAVLLALSFVPSAHVNVGDAFSSHRTTHHSTPARPGGTGSRGAPGNRVDGGSHRHQAGSRGPGAASDASLALRTGARSGS